MMSRSRSGLLGEASGLVKFEWSSSVDRLGADESPGSDVGLLGRCSNDALPSPSGISPTFLSPLLLVKHTLAYRLHSSPTDHKACFHSLLTPTEGWSLIFPLPIRTGTTKVFSSAITSLWPKPIARILNLQ